MTEILQAEIVAYSNPKEIFVNGLSRDSAHARTPARYKLIDTAAKRQTACWAGLPEDADCGKAEGACAKMGRRNLLCALCVTFATFAV
jgi:hypothetical protein